MILVLTEKGFKRPTYDDLLKTQINRAKQLFGEDIDTSGESILGKYLRINVQDLAECYELLEDIYYARFTNSARGQNLDRLCPFAGVTRNPATASRIKVLFRGNVGALVNAAFLISGAGLTFYIDNTYTVDASGTVVAYANCAEVGTVGNISIGTVLSIVNPDPDLESVEMIEIDIYGKERESDKALRIRFGKAVAGAGSGTPDAIKGAVSRIALVDGVEVVENDTHEIVDGRPPNSFECYVLAPDSQDELIAEAIFSRKPAGIRAIGDIESTVYDAGGKARIVKFSRMVQKDIFVKVTVLTNKYFEADGADQIKDSLMGYINNLSNGEAVYMSSLYGYIHDIHGVLNVQNLTVSEDGEVFQATNIPVSSYEIARVSAERIEIEVLA